MSSPQPVAMWISRSPLAAPVLAEQTHELLSEQLEQALLPLEAHCAKQEAREDLSDWQADRVDEIRQALAVLMRYDGQVEDLLESYRQALAAAQEALAAQVLDLDEALRPTWHDNPVYRLGYVRGRKAAAEQLARVAARPEPTASSSPLVGYLQRYLAQPHLQTRLALPADHRRALANINSFTLSAPQA